MLTHLRALALLVTVSTGVPWRDASAQSPSRPTARQRVRVHLAGGRAPIEGTVVRWTADTLVLGPLSAARSHLDTLLRVPRESIVGYQPSLGRDHGRGFVRGAKVGAIVGGAVGLALVIVGAIYDSRAEEVFISPPRRSVASLPSAPRSAASFWARGSARSVGRSVGARHSRSRRPAIAPGPDSSRSCSRSLADAR
jgi:hypothetical protein